MEEPDSTNRLMQACEALLTKRGILIALVALILGGGGVSFGGSKLADVLGPTPQVEVISGEIQQMIDTTLDPIQADMDAQRSQLQMIQQSVKRNEEASSRITEQLAKTTEIVHELAGQVKILVDLQLRNEN